MTLLRAMGTLEKAEGTNWSLGGIRLYSAPKGILPQASGSGLMVGFFCDTGKGAAFPMRFLASGRGRKKGLLLLLSIKQVL